MQGKKSHLQTATKVKFKRDPKTKKWTTVFLDYDHLDLIESNWIKEVEQDLKLRDKKAA